MSSLPPSKLSIRLMYLRGMTGLLQHWLYIRGSTYSFNGKAYRYFSHPYNLTWMNERAVEIPLALEAIQESSPDMTLEVGNVLSHYQTRSDHHIIDKYETGNLKVENIDACEYVLKFPCEKIVSISTLEHIGWDESPIEPEKAWKTILHLSKQLSEKGNFFFTIPAGYNPALDECLVRHRSFLGPLRAMRRSSTANKWEECSAQELQKTLFGTPFPFANAIYIGTATRDLEMQNVSRI